MGITLSKEHGVNPSIECCPICGKEVGIILFGRLKGDKKAPIKTYGPHLCDDCQKIIDADGAIVIEVKDGSDPRDPHRTGRIVGLSKEGKEKLKLNGFATYMIESIFTKLFTQNEDSETQCRNMETRI